ncbi:MAG: methyl-accepting chemotaxis protein [Sideroxydans sp.]|nr:methyl-accepting chemotaxis protein [Sideroxydans sp.]
MAFNLASLKLPKLFGKAAQSVEEEIEGLRLPFISDLPFNKQLRVLGVALLVFLLLAVVSAYLDNRAASQGTRYVAQSSELLMLSQRLAKDAQQALDGNYLAFDDMAQSRQQMDSILTLLDKGDARLPATSGSPRPVLDRLIKLVQKTENDVQAVEDGRPGLVTVKAAINASDVYSQELRDVLQDLIAHLDGADRQRAIRLALLIERIARDASLMLGSNVTTDQVGSLGHDTLEAEDLLNALPATDPLVLKAKDLFYGYRISAEAVIGNAQGLLGAKQAGQAIFRDSDEMLKQARALTSEYQSVLSGRVTSAVMTLSSGMVLLLLLVLSKEYLDESRRRAREAEQSNHRNQQAILLLMNEMADLADGDLTVKATVSDAITGAIADAVNYTTDELRKLVSGVTVASGKVAQATDEAKTIAQALLAATQKQASELRNTGEAVELITKSIQEVDSSATQSAQVARHTLEVTEQGALAVRNTIAGMDGIREQIQETSKRIKRLGESSQEIGEIVDLISDITEQTNVLALNAAIQAASAGEAGRGFSVVAEEVQRLAERSAEATKQIGALVKTIQGDTQNAVAAMEKSTQGVVEGAKLSDAAGQSLQEIEQVSRELSGLINSISVSTQVQTDMANEVAAAMAEILLLTEQTTDGTRKTNASVTDLADLAIDLRASVAGFKL